MWLWRQWPQIVWTRGWGWVGNKRKMGHLRLSSWRSSLRWRLRVNNRSIVYRRLQRMPVVLVPLDLRCICQTAQLCRRKNRRRPWRWRNWKRSWRLRLLCSQSLLLHPSRLSYRRWGRRLRRLRSFSLPFPQFFTGIKHILNDAPCIGNIPSVRIIGCQASLLIFGSQRAVLAHFESLLHFFPSTFGNNIVVRLRS